LDWAVCGRCDGLGWLWARTRVILAGLVMRVCIDGSFVHCLTCPRSELARHPLSPPAFFFPYRVFVFVFTLVCGVVFFFRTEFSRLASCIRFAISWTAPISNQTSRYAMPFAIYSIIMKRRATLLLLLYSSNHSPHFLQLWQTRSCRLSQPRIT